MAAETGSVHASAVLVGSRGVLIRGPAGSGKSRLALALIGAADAGLIRFARLIGDDRVQLSASHGRLLVRPAAELAGLIEVRGLGICTLPHEPAAVLGWVIDLAAEESPRLPVGAATEAVIAGITLPRLAVSAAVEPLPGTLAALRLDRTRQ
jgi:hypothetical protein